MLVSPLRQENLGPPLPDPDAHNGDVQLYTAAIARLAAERHLQFVDLFDGMIASGLTPASVRLTDNGMHLTAAGYWRADAQNSGRSGLPDDRVVRRSRRPDRQGFENRWD